MSSFSRGFLKVEFEFLWKFSLVFCFFWGKRWSAARKEGGKENLTSSTLKGENFYAAAAIRYQGREKEEKEGIFSPGIVVGENRLGRKTYLSNEFSRGRDGFGSGLLVLSFSLPNSLAWSHFVSRL